MNKDMRGTAQEEAQTPAAQPADQSAMELVEHELDQVSGGRITLLDDVLCEECGAKKDKVSDPCPNILCTSHHIT